MNYIQTIITAGLTSGLVAFLFQTIVKYNADKKLETYKQQLNQYSENLKFGLQKKYQDFNLYTLKRHEYIPELFRLLIIADSTIRSLFGLSKVLTYVEYNKEDMIERLKGKKVVNGKIESIMGKWDVDKGAAIEEAKIYLRMLEFQEAKVNWIEASNYFHLHELYYSSHIAALSKNLLKDIHTLYVLSEISEPGSHEARSQIERRLDDQIDEIRELMKSELGDAYYQS